MYRSETRYTVVKPGGAARRRMVMRSTRTGPRTRWHERMKQSQPQTWKMTKKKNKKRMRRKRRKSQFCISNLSPIRTKIVHNKRERRRSVPSLQLPFTTKKKCIKSKVPVGTLLAWPAVGPNFDESHLKRGRKPWMRSTPTEKQGRDRRQQRGGGSTTSTRKEY